MILFPKLDLDFPTCYSHKINRTIPDPGGLERTKNSVRLGRIIIKVAPALSSKLEVRRKHPITTRSRGISPQSNAQDHQSSAPIAFETFLHMLAHQKLVKSSSLLKSMLKLHVQLKIDELLCPPGSYLCMDFFMRSKASGVSLVCWMSHEF